jgi:hypothetical protein
MQGLNYCDDTFSPNESRSNESAKDAAKRSTTNFESCKKRFFEGSVRRYEEHSKSIPTLLGVDFAIIVFGWLVAWFLISIGRWIRRGFA